MRLDRFGRALFCLECQISPHQPCAKWNINRHRFLTVARLRLFD